MHSPTPRVASTQHRKPRKYAIWTPETGLIVTPNVTRLPDCAPVDTPRRIDYTRPRNLNNGTVFLAFYPRVPLYHGPVLGVLDVSDHLLRTTMEELSENEAYGPNKIFKYGISPDIKRRWERLEDLFVRIGTLLIEKHPKFRHIPEIQFPFRPSSTKYHRFHASHQGAIKSAYAALDLFNQWGAVLSFGFALWLGKNPDNCFEDAFKMLLDKAPGHFTPNWLNQLKDSQICNMVLGPRVGGIFDAYTFRFGPWVDNMVALGVPLWFRWGSEEEMQVPNHVHENFFYVEYMPSRNIIDLAKSLHPMRDVPRSTIPDFNKSFYDPSRSTLPPANSRMQLDSSGIHTVEGPRHNGNFPRHSWAFPVSSEDVNGMNEAYDSPPDVQSSSWGTILDEESRGSASKTNVAMDIREGGSGSKTNARQDIRAVDSSSRQRHGEDYKTFFERLKRERLSYIRQETAGQKQRREALEQSAARGQLGGKMTVFYWRKIEAGTDFFWRRDRLTKNEADGYWSDMTPHQRIFHGHISEWDLCPMLPEYPEGVARPPSPKFVLDIFETASDYGEDDNYGNDMNWDTRSLDSTGVRPASTTVDLNPPQPPQVVSECANRMDDRSDNDTGCFGPLSVAENSGDNFVEDAGQALGVANDNSMDVDDAAVSDEHEQDTISLRTLLRSFFGYAGVASTSVPPSPDTLKAARQIAINLGYTSVGLTDNDVVSVTQFCFHLESASSKINPTPLPSSWDIGKPSTSPFPLRQAGFNAQVVPQKAGKYIYIISTSNFVKGSDDWVVVVHSPLLFLFICREINIWNDLPSLVQLLLRRRVPFEMPKTIHVSKRPPDIKDEPSVGLGIRPKGWKPNAQDYTDYCMMLNGIGASAQGRGLRIKGGLLSRLVESYVPAAKVLEGPAKLDCVVGKLDDNYLLVEDFVPEKYVDMVHGLYGVHNTNSPNDISRKSYWPPPSRWILGAFAFGAWSPAAEKWYQTNLEKKMGPEPETVSSQEWRFILRFYRKHIETIYSQGEQLAKNAVHATAFPSAQSTSSSIAASPMPSLASSSTQRLDVDSGSQRPKKRSRFN